MDWSSVGAVGTEEGDDFFGAALAEEAELILTSIKNKRSSLDVNTNIMEYIDPIF
ncbi:MAG: hypothetical protein ACYTFW_23900 [Planctomycetota bacterium]|jgi:hypothetical protein